MCPIYSSRLTKLDTDEAQHFNGAVRIGCVSDCGIFSVGGSGPYQKDEQGQIIVKAYHYDASAASGSRFTQIADLDAQNTMLGDAGDRIYFGSPYKFWATRLIIGVAKSNEVLEAYYWNGALTEMAYMGIKRTSVESIGRVIWEQIAEIEYAIWDKDIDLDWTATDDQLDEIPDTGDNLYWICFQVPVGGLVTPARIDQIKLRASSFAILGEGIFPVFFGKTRYINHEMLEFDLFKSPSGTPIITIDITNTQQQEVYEFRTNLNDSISHKWILPHGIDTSCKITFCIDYAADAAINTADILLDVRKIKNNTTINNAQVSDLSSTTNINVAAGDKVYLNEALDELDISDMFEDEMLMIQITRTDNNGNSFYPLMLKIRYTRWTAGLKV